MPQEMEFTNEVVQEAASWLQRMECCEGVDSKAFIRWISSDPSHVRHILELHALLFEARYLLRTKRRAGQPARHRPSS